MENLTNYSDNELSLTVMNDEYLYNCALELGENITEVIDNHFHYTDIQLGVLLEDIKELGQE